jgi:TRAF3-interacting protein 1
MSEKLLCKPPFRYMHDIFTATMSATGFAQGLYTEQELDAKAIADKQAKVEFLAKMIAVTEMMVGEKIDVNPNKIVAGAEADKTNLFLQQLFRAATCGEDSTPAVRQVLGIPDGGEEDGGDDQAAAEAQE